MTIMKVPESIRKVKRPKNTVVIATSEKEGLKQYEVKERKKSVYRPGHNPMPVNGAVIGYIYDGRFIERAERLEEKTEVKSYGGSMLAYSLSRDVFEDLCRIYDIKEAGQIYTIALLRVIRKGVTDRRLSSAYECSYLSELMKDVPLSENTVSDLIRKLGGNYSLITRFMQLKASEVVKGHHVAIDGMLKQDSSDVNDLSSFSFKSRIRGVKDISVLYAYDIETREPVCSKIYPGNMIDARAYADFVRESGLKEALFVDDKGFPPSEIEGIVKENPDIGYLTPLKRSTKKGSDDIYLFDTAIRTAKGTVPARKKELENGRFLYCYRDTDEAGSEEKGYLRKNGKSLDCDDYQKKLLKFGTIVLESNKDMDLLTAYNAYSDRWMIELMFKAYKSSLDLDQTRVQGNCSVIGSEFINFLSSLVTSRIMREFEKAGLIDDDSYGDVMDDLNSALKIKKGDQWVLSDTNKGVLEKMYRLNIEKGPEPKEKKKRGRPKKKQDASKTSL